jgi:hypothetical protein
MRTDRYNMPLRSGVVAVSTEGRHRGYQYFIIVCCQESKIIWMRGSESMRTKC